MPFAGGKCLGNVGSYERLLGTVAFAIDPNEKDLPFICDPEFAPRNADGLVEFKAVTEGQRVRPELLTCCLTSEVFSVPL
jgi:hypothetical protein